jgi:hypothetical protein
MPSLNVPATLPETILDKARNAVFGDRMTDYGPVKADMVRIAQMWSAILGFPIQPFQVPMCMIALKLSRLTYSLKDDSIVDVAGWAAVLEQAIKE